MPGRGSSRRRRGAPCSMPRARVLGSAGLGNKPECLPRPTASESTAAGRDGPAAAQKQRWQLDRGPGRKGQGKSPDESCSSQLQLPHRSRCLHASSPTAGDINGSTKHSSFLGMPSSPWGMALESMTQSVCWPNRCRAMTSPSVMVTVVMMMFRGEKVVGVRRPGYVTRVSAGDWGMQLARGPTCPLEI